MGSIVKPRAVEIYGALLYIYPPSFRKHYSATMAQTFDDMLAGESTWVGRGLVWIRTLVDLPLSAGREYITKGREIPMNRNTKFMLAGVIAAILIAGAGSFWFGTLRARQSIAIERVSVGELADAMQQDSFYSTYGDTALLFSGKVASLKSGSNVTLVTFTTNRPYNLVCQFPATINAKVGQTLSVGAPGGSADREASGVLLHDCILN